MSKLIFDQQLTSGYAYATREEELIDVLIENWKFYRPSAPLVQHILRLREKLGERYLDNEYSRNRAKQSDIESDKESKDIQEVESELTKKNGFELAIKYVAGILGVSSQHENTQPADSSDEAITQHQGFISERIYNHLAMLGRTPRTLRGGAFSIRKELTEGIAEKIGLGLYLSPRMNKELRKETETVLLEMANEYQEWLLEKTQEGPFETTWGYICVANQKLSKEQQSTYPLILNPDMAKTKVATKK